MHNALRMLCKSVHNVNDVDIMCAIDRHTNIYFFSKRLLQMPQEFTRWMQENVPALLDKLRIPGVAVATIENGETRFAGGFGFADKEQGRAVSTGTQFQLASISKSVTS